MKFFFDNNLSRHLAHAMGELSKTAGDVQAVIHLRDRFEGDAPDVEWIAALAADGPWCIVSIDRFTKNHDAEREALRRAGHTVFVLDRQWSRQTFWLQAERLVRWWPQVLASSRLIAGGALRVPWHHSASARFTQIKL